MVVIWKRVINTYVALYQILLKYGLINANNDFGWPVDPIQTTFDIGDDGVMINSVTDLSETDSE